MIKVKVFRTSDNQQGWGGLFSSMEEANFWADSQQAMNAWGKPVHWVLESELTSEQIASAIDFKTEMGERYRKLDAEYEVEFEDLHDEEIEQKWADIRAERDARLAACDWTQLVDAPMNISKKQEWRDYRQALRDVPQNIFDINEQEAQWPEKPE